MANMLLRVKELSDACRDMWFNTSSTFPRLKEEYTDFQKLKAEMETEKFIEKFFKLIKEFPKEEEKRKEWKVKTDEVLEVFFSKSPLITPEENKLLVKGGLLEATENFIKEAKCFDKKLSASDISQAMRNVWIMNVIQLLLNKKVELTHSIFSYSMLYPYTDNYLDHKDITKEEKIIFNSVLRKRLNGIEVVPENEVHKKIFALVERIEKEFYREKYNNVFESLLAIHGAQEKSLSQQESKTYLCEKDIFAISIEKGGTSVLADAYLVKGELEENESFFFFGFGVLLQICDDLQDVRVDHKNSHITLLSKVAYEWPLDNITNNLINFNLKLIDEAKCFKCKDIEILKKVLKQKCLHLILFAIAKNKRFYSKEYFKAIEKYFPYRTGYMVKFYSKLNKKYGKLKRNIDSAMLKEAIVYSLK